MPNLPTSHVQLGKGGIGESAFASQIVGHPVLVGLCVWGVVVKFIVTTTDTKA